MQKQLQQHHNRMLLPPMILLLLSVLIAPPRGASADEPLQKPAQVEAPLAEQKLVTWRQRLAPAIDEARRRKVSILVRAGAEWCPWCRKLDDEIVKPEVQHELRNWVLVYLDIDENPDDARRVNIGPIPALRVLGADGRVAASRDGYLPADKLVAWLLEQGEQTEHDGAADVTDVAELDADSVSRLVRQLAHRDANVREAVIRRISSAKHLAAADVVQAFTRGNLAARLAALELLGGWQAPIQDLDPWQPGTITAARLNDLEAWVDHLEAADADPASPAVVPLSPEQLAAARAEIVKLASADPAEVEAIGARLARHGEALVPEVREQRQRAETDKARERLDALRYRLVASDALALKWPGGLAKLAATDAHIRHDAAAELPQMVTGGDEGLLIELFGHPDPLVRELSLKALHGVGGTRANAELTRLLADPEPNVRAAVLKQLAEKPTTKLVPQIAAYIAQETDPDLVVHAVRLLREIKGQAAIDCLTQLLSHESWQVRAETVDAIGESVSDRNQFSYGQQNEASASLMADAYAAILAVLPDQDGFVVSRAVSALKTADFALAADPLARAAERHPELAQAAAEALTAGENIRPKALPLLKAWLTHKEENLRAAALRALNNINALDGESELVPALSDVSEKVRIAAAEQLLHFCVQHRPSNGRDLSEPFSRRQAPLPPTLVGQALQFDSDAVRQKSVANPAAAEVENDPDEKLHPFESWLTRFRSGQAQREWMNKSIEPLQNMLRSPSTAEQLAAGVSLVALGRDEQALPVLTRIATEQRQQVAAVAGALSWLPWEQRLRLFGVLKSLAPDAEQLALVCGQLVLLPDTRACAPLWEVLASDTVTAALAQSVFSNFSHVHGIQTYADPPPKPIGVDLAALQRYAVSGKRSQSRVALALLLQVDESAAIAAGQAVFADEKIPAARRADGLCIVLLASSKKEARVAAVSALSQADAVASKPALAYLALGESSVQSFADGEFYLSKRHAPFASNNHEKDELPRELTADHVRPFLASQDDDSAAQAAYLLALLGEPAGLDRLIAHWRGAGARSQPWNKLVYEAIAASDDARHVPLLAEIYGSLDHAPFGNGEVRELYWAIRSMHGPEVLKLRKRIRDEVGMDNLR